jgi:hypothetical protein
MAFTTLMEKAMLDWMTGGAAASRPSARFIGWATGSPDDNGASEARITRGTCTFAAANSPQGSVTNLNSVFGTNTGPAATFVGWNLYDAAAGGNRLAYGTLTSQLGCRASGTDQCSVGPGGLKVILT